MNRAITPWLFVSFHEVRLSTFSCGAACVRVSTADSACAPDAYQHYAQLHTTALLRIACAMLRVSATAVAASLIWPVTLTCVLFPWLQPYYSTENTYGQATYFKVR